MNIQPHASKIVGFAVAVSALSLSFGGWALASHSSQAHHTGQNVAAPTASPNGSGMKTGKLPAKMGSNKMPVGGTRYGDDIYKVENGVVYEYDDGWWEPQFDKKIEGGIVYDFDDGRWKVDYDPSKAKKPKSNNTAPQAKPKPQTQTQVAPRPAPKPQTQNNTRPNSKYKVENGVVYEWDDGRWEREYDKKAQNGSIYEYDDGRWERDYDDDWDDDWDD